MQLYKKLKARKERSLNFSIIIYLCPKSIEISKSIAGKQKFSYQHAFCLL